MLALSHLLDTVHRGAQKGEYRTGVAGAVRLQQGQLVHLLQRHIRRVGDGGVHFQTAHGLFPTGGRFYAAVHPLAESVNIPLRDGEACRQLVAAEAVQQVGAGFQRGKEVEATVGAAGAFAGAVLEMDHKAGGGVFFTEAGGHDAHHPLMPVLAGEYQRVALLRAQLFDLRHGVGADGLLHRLPFPVQIAQLSGQLLRSGRIAFL